MASQNRALAAVLGVVVVAAVGLWLLGRNGDWVRVTTTTTLASKGVVFESELKLFVVHSNTGPVALSAMVPHERTDYVRFCPRSGLFESEFLGAKFDPLGIYYGGPGERSLDRVQSKIEDGVVYVNPDEITRGPARGERDPKGPRGQFCTPT